MVYLFSDSGSFLEIDGDIKQAHSVKSSITNFPLEDGSFTSDHTIKLPNTFSVSMIVDEDGSAIDVYEKLLQMRENRELLQIQTNLKLDKDYMIKSIDVIEEVSTGLMTMFSVVFKQVKFSKSKQTKIERSTLKDGSAKDKLQSKSKRGIVDHKKIRVEKVEVPKATKPKSKDEVVVVQPKQEESMLYRILK